MSRLPSLLSPSDHVLLQQVVRKVMQQDANLTNRIGGPEVGGPNGYLPPSVFRFKNDSGESVPRFGVMRITGGLGDDHITIAKPNATLQPMSLVNIGGAVAADGFGKASFLTAESFNVKTHHVLYNTANTPAYGEMWGPTSGTWTIAKNNPGFLIIGGNTGTGTLARTIAVQSFAELTDHVQVWTTSGSPTAGDVLEANADNYFPGRIRSFLGGSAGTGVNCWIKFVDWHDADTGDVYALHGKHFAGRFNGTVTSESTAKPLYVVSQGNFECWCKPDADIAAGASGTVSLYNDDFTDSTINRASTLAKFMAVKSGKWCQLIRTMGTYIVQPAECQTP